MKILPTSPVTVSTYWTLMAQVAQNLSGEGGEGVAVGAADEYLEALMARLSQWHGSALPAVAAAGEAMAAAVLGGGKLFPYSGRGEFFSEASGTAGGLMGVYNLEVELSGGKAELTGELGADDVVILAWVLAEPAAETAVARAVKQAGATLIGLFPFERETPSNTKQRRPFFPLFPFSASVGGRDRRGRRRCAGGRGERAVRSFVR